MKNKSIGIMFICFAAFLGLIIFLFNRALNKIVTETCSHGYTCPMYSTIEFNTYLSIGIVVAVLFVGLAFIFFLKDNSKRKEFDKSSYSDLESELKQDERLVLNVIVAAKGNIFQSDIVEKTGFMKAKVTRILDRLEAKDIIERKRRGMTNFIVLK